MEPCPPARSRTCRTRRPDRGRSRRLRGIGAAAAVAALAVAAGAATWAAAAGPPAPTRALAVAGLSGLVRAVAPPPRQRVVVFTTIGAALLCVPLALLYRRRREQLRRRAVIAALQHARAPQVFEAARTTRPLLRLAPPAGATTRATDTPAAPGALTTDMPTSPATLAAEVAACAAELRADAVREAAARAVMLRAASERSETRRRAAALRARARLAPGAGPSAPAPAAPTVEVRVAEPPTPARREAEPAPAAAAQPTASPPPPAGRNAARVALLRTSGPLTFEWLEQCLARDPQDIQARLDLCTALLVAERFADAERFAREGLEREPANGRLLLRLSEALTGQERNDEALEVAVRAVRTHRSRKAILHLTRLSAVARRFSPADGARLRKALESRPNDPVFLHALGAFEAQHGDPREALPILRLALRQERSPRWRRVVSREIARLRADELRAAGAFERRGDGVHPRRAAG